MKLFNAKFYVCGTCQKHLNKNEVPFQAICTKMALDPTRDELLRFEQNSRKF